MHIEKRQTVTNIGFAAFLTAIFGIAFLLAQDFTTSARRGPLLFAGLGVVLGLVIMVRGIVQLLKPRSEDTADRLTNSLIADEKLSLPAAPRKFVISDGYSNGTTDQQRGAFEPIGWLGLFAVSFWALGSTWSIPVFLTLYLKVRAKESWFVTILLATVTTVVMSYFFFGILRASHYTGYLPQRFF